MPSNTDPNARRKQLRPSSAQPGPKSHTHATEVGSRDEPPPSPNRNVPHFLRDDANKKNTLTKHLERVQNSGSGGPRDRLDDDAGVAISGQQPPGVDQDGTAEPRQHVRIAESQPRSREGTRSADGSDPALKGHPGDPIRGPGRQRDAIIRIDPLSAQDVTVHMSLPVRDDLEDVLEEASRLRRLGHFNEAIALFRDRLSHFLDNRYVLVQYAQCLYDAGQYAQLEKLARDKDPPRIKTPDGADALQLNWDMLLLAADLRPPGHFDLDAMHRAVEIVMAKTWPELDSTQCQVLALCSKISLPMERALPRRGIFSLYRKLIRRGMVWEFRDLLREHLKRSDPLDVLTSITTPFMDSGSAHSAPPPPPPTPAEHLKLLHKLWTERAEDEPTLFALLDSFTALALHARQTYHSKEMMRASMAVADECGAALLAIDDGNLMTRPCLRWIVAKRMIRDNHDLLFNHQLAVMPGARPQWEVGPLGFSSAVFPSDHLPKPYFREGLAVEWKPRPVLPGEHDDFAATTEMVLRAAEELGDQELQTGCLRELMYRGIRPAGEVLSQLRKIWTEAGNKPRLPELNFFRALLAHTPSERQALQRDILLEIETGYMSYSIDRFYLLAALSPDRAQKMDYQAMAEALEAGAESNDSSQGTAEPHDGHSLPAKTGDRSAHGPTPHSSSALQPMKMQSAQKPSLPARPAPQLPAPAPAAGPAGPAPVQQAHPATNETATDWPSQRIAQIKDEMAIIERAFLSFEKGKDGRRELLPEVALHARLYRLMEEQSRLEKERLESDDCASDVDDVGAADALGAAGEPARARGPASPSPPPPPRRRTTVEDYSGTPDSSNNTERLEGEKTGANELRARQGTESAALLLEYGGQDDEGPPVEDDSDDKASDC